MLIYSMSAVHIEIDIIFCFVLKNAEISSKEIDNNK